MSKFLIEEPPLQVLPTLACQVGLNEAIVLQQFKYWLDRSNNIKDGHKWIYNSYQEWNKQFPFWGKNTLVRAINNLEKEELLISGNFNKAKFDKTKWYRINYDRLDELEGLGKRSTQNGLTRNPKWVNGETQNGLTNTNRLPENTTETTKRNKKESSDDLSGQTSLTDRFEKLWKLYPKKQGKQVAFRAYKRAVKKGTEDKDIELGIANYKKYIQLKKISSQYIKQGSTWFNQGCWEDEYDYGNQPQQKKRQYLF